MSNDNFFTGLTLENYFNEAMIKWPAEVNHFCQWIDEYKKRVNWNILFNSDSEYQNAAGKNAPAPKFHHIPYEMQFGIIMQYLKELGTGHSEDAMCEMVAAFYTSSIEDVTDALNTFFMQQNATTFIKNLNQ